MVKVLETVAFVWLFVKPLVADWFDILCKAKKSWRLLSFERGLTFHFTVRMKWICILWVYVNYGGNGGYGGKKSVNYGGKPKIYKLRR